MIIMVVELKVFNEITGIYLDIKDKPRIISLAPAITDTLDKLGVWENIVGVSLYCNIPSKASKKPRVGAYLKVSYRRIDALKPDIIFLTTGIQRKLIFEMLEKNYPVYPVPLPISIYGILENMTIIGAVLGMMESSLNLMKKYLDILSKIKDDIWSSAYYEIDFGEPYTIGGISYINHALNHIGLKNIFSNIKKTYFIPDLNRVAEEDPEIIIYEVHPGKKMDVDKIRKIFIDRGWSNIKAVANDKIYILPPDSLAHYGPTLINNLENISIQVKK